MMNAMLNPARDFMNETLTFALSVANDWASVSFLILRLCHRNGSKQMRLWYRRNGFE